MGRRLVAWSYGHFSSFFSKKKERAYLGWCSWIGLAFRRALLGWYCTVHNHEGQLYIEASTDTFEFKKF